MPLSIQKLINRIRSFKDNDDGAAAMEFALTALLFIILMFAVLEAGRMAWEFNTLQYTVEDTARYAALNPNLGDDDYETYATDVMASMLVSTDPLSISLNRISEDGIDLIEVTGTYTHNAIFNFLIPGDLTVATFNETARHPFVPIPD